MSQFRQQTVVEFLFGKCSKILMHQLADDEEETKRGDYWLRVENFVENNKAKIIGTLTFDQQQWLIKIKDDLLDQAKKRSA